MATSFTHRATSTRWSSAKRDTSGVSWVARGSSYGEGSRRRATEGRPHHRASPHLLHGGDTPPTDGPAANREGPRSRIFWLRGDRGSRASLLDPGRLLR